MVARRRVIGAIMVVHALPLMAVLQCLDPNSFAVSPKFKDSATLEKMRIETN
jgi:hypothetical protein